MDLTLGLVDRILDEVACACDELLGEVLLSADPETRRVMCDLHDKLCAALRDRCENKLKFWKQLPHSLVGVLGCLFRVCSEDESRQRAIECLQEYSAAILAGLAEKLHRVAHYLLGATSLRVQLEAFASSQLPLLSWPQLVIELMGYALVVCVSRRVEAVHSHILSAKRKATCHNMPFIGSKIRPALASVCIMNQSPGVQSWVLFTQPRCWKSCVLVVPLRVHMSLFMRLRGRDEQPTSISPSSTRADYVREIIHSARFLLPSHNAYRLVCYQCPSALPGDQMF